MVKLNKTNLILCILFSMIATLIARHIINNLDSIVQLRLDFLFTFMMVTTILNGIIAIYFLVQSWEYTDLLDYFYESVWDAIAKPNKYRWFNPEAGLCHNFISFQEWYGIDNPSMVRLYKQLKDAGLDKAYPFNNSSSEYSKEVVYQNIKRLEWIKSHIKEKV